MNKAIYDEIGDTGKELSQVLSSFTQEQLNAIPFAGSWTAGQVAEHVLKSVSGTLQNVNGEVKPTERNPVQYADLLKEIFLNFNIKMTSPDFILPTDEPKNKEALINLLNTSMIGLEDAAKTEDLSATCLSFEMPTMGPLTRMEWLSFANAHTLRHIHQLKNIKQVLNEKN
jgi:hypothetical protein